MTNENIPHWFTTMFNFKNMILLHESCTLIKLLLFIRYYVLNCQSKQYKHYSKLWSLFTITKGDKRMTTDLILIFCVWSFKSVHQQHKFCNICSFWFFQLQNIVLKIFLPTRIFTLKICKFMLLWKLTIFAIYHWLLSGLHCTLTSSVVLRT